MQQTNNGENFRFSALQYLITKLQNLHCSHTCVRPIMITIMIYMIEDRIPFTFLIRRSFLSRTAIQGNHKK